MMLGKMGQNLAKDYYIHYNSRVEWEETLKAALKAYQSGDEKTAVSSLYKVALESFYCDGKSRDDYDDRKRKIELYKTSVLYRSKKKASDTRWRRRPCKHCHGKGHVVIVLHKGNTSIRLLKQCPWCDGTGTRGLSKL